MKRATLLLVLACSLFLGGCAEEERRRVLPQKRFEARGESRVEIIGHWVSDQKTEIPVLPSTNSVSIKCERAYGACYEAVAAISTVPGRNAEFLLPILHHYKVSAWTRDKIVARAELPVADVTLEIDLANSSVRRRHQETRSRGNETADPSTIYQWHLQ